MMSFLVMHFTGPVRCCSMMKRGNKNVPFMKTQAAFISSGHGCFKVSLQETQRRNTEHTRIQKNMVTVTLPCK